MPRTTRQPRRIPVMALAAGLSGLMAVGAIAGVGVLSAPKPFELVFNGKHEEVPVDADFAIGIRHAGSFTSAAPFCGSGSGVDTKLPGIDTATRRFMCADGSGSLTLFIAPPQAEAGGGGSWSIVEGTGQYAGLRGRGTFRGEFVSGDPFNHPSTTYRSTFQGIVDADAIGPTIAVSTAKATKVKAKKGVYALRLVLAIRDNVEGNQVAYTLTARVGGSELARKSGATATGVTETMLRIRPPNTRARAVRIAITALDPVGNESSLERTVKLPR